MLNLLRSSKLEIRKFRIEMMMTFGMAALMVAALIVWEEIDAQQEMAQAISNPPSLVSMQQVEVISETEAANAQLELARLKSRVNYLTRRQEERDDLNEVQAILLANHGVRKGVMAELHSLHWQHGKLEFEGLSEDPEKWHSLMNDMILFNRWKTAPQIFHAHRAMSKPLHSGASLVEVKLKAALWAHASNPPMIRAAP
ncbi:MAG: hypothetical protein RIT13_2234 [Pseudomonadota bacterium]|jgi:hypothetical protein